MQQGLPRVALSGNAPPAAHAASTFLARFGRAVQRMSMYPVGHPAATAGIGSLVDAAHALLKDGPVSMAVGKNRVIVSTGAQPATEHAAPWLAGRLFDRGISAIAVDGDFDAEEISRLVTWLAAPADNTRAFPNLAGFHLARFDGNHVKFQEEATPQRSTPEAETAWRVLASGLQESLGVSAAVAPDPEALAEHLRGALVNAEETGVSMLSDRLVEEHSRSRSSGAPPSDYLARNLAELIERLRPELAGSLLTIGPADNPKQIHLVEDVLEHLSLPALQHIVEHIRLEGISEQGPFSGFLQKLLRVSLSDPSLEDALEQRLTGAQIPAAIADHLANFGIDSRPKADAGAPTEFVSKPYRAQLDLLVVGGGHTGSAVAPKTTVGVAPDQLEEHLARLAHLEAGRDPGAPDAVPYLRCLLELAPHQRATGRIDVLATSAELMQRAGAANPTAATTRNLVEQFGEFLQETASVSVLVQSIRTAPIGGDRSSVLLLSAAGPALVRRVMDWLKTTADEQVRAHVAAALVSIDLDVCRKVVLADVAENRHLAEALGHVLDRIDPARAIEVAFQLLTVPSVDARCQAVAWLLSTPISSGKQQRVFQRAIEDDDPRIVALAIDGARRRPSPMAVEALSAFIERRVPNAFAPLQARAVHALAASGPDAVAHLAQALAARKFAWSASARRLSVSIASALKSTNDAGARAAARAWQLSAAGALCWLTHTREEAAQ